MATLPKVFDHWRCGFPWLDGIPELREWFAKWLIANWRRIYSESLRQLHSKKDFARYRRMEKAVQQLGPKLPSLSTVNQLRALHAAACRCGFDTTPKHVEDELRYFLTSSGQRPEHAAAFKASPWCNHFAEQAHISERLGYPLACQLYPRQPDLQLAVESLVSEFGSPEIWREASSTVSRLLQLERCLKDLKKALDDLSSEDPVQSNDDLRNGMRTLAASLHSEIGKCVKEPAWLIPPLRVRRRQRALYGAVRRLCRPKDGPDQLAGFISHMLERWPHIPAGGEFSLEETFDSETCRDFVCDHLGLSKWSTDKTARALLRVLSEAIFREQLRNPLLQLAADAESRSAQRRKGWEHLRRGLKLIFRHITREPTDEEQFRNFERAIYPHVRNLTREQRNRSLPELGNDPDTSVRDLTKAERMSLAERDLQHTKKPLQRDADGRNSFATRYGRAMKAVRKELGQ